MMKNPEMKELEMKELETVNGGMSMDYLKTAGIVLRKEMHEKAVNKPTVSYEIVYDKEDMEYLEDILDPEDLSEYFAC